VIFQTLVSTMPEVEENNKEKEEEDVEEEEEVKAPKAKGHDSGSADLEKVTDYAEDKEILSTGKDLEDALQAIRSKQVARTAERLARERELAKVAIAKEDVELIVAEMEIPRERAERCLREQGGDVVAALTALVNMPVMA